VPTFGAMSGNTFGNFLKITTFGESHGVMMGAVIDGLPAGLSIDLDFIRKELQRRKPGQSHITTQRKEDEEFQIVSGVFEGKSLGTSIAILIPNSDAKSKDYNHLKDVYRPSHADFTYDKKYGHRDYRGGGRASARETVARVAAAGAVQALLNTEGVECFSFVSSIHDIEAKVDHSMVSIDDIESNIVRCPDQEAANSMIKRIEEIKKDGDSVGGIITGIIRNCPVGLGEPVFQKLHADLASAMMGINAVKGFELGLGFSSTGMKGSEHNDAFTVDGDKITTGSNNSGGIQGGISNGMDIIFKVAFKPVATIMKVQETVDNSGNVVELEGRGRHDPCVVPRAVPIVDAMARLVIADHLLMQRIQGNG
jgi:chorismate synthase